MSSLSKALTSRAIPIEAYRLSPQSLPIGETATIGNAEITYRQEGHKLTIIIYSRPIRSRGLSNPFSEMVWLIDFIKRELPEIRTIYTTVMAIEASGYRPAPPVDKLHRFYLRYFRASDAGCIDGQSWLKLELRE